MTDKMKLVPVEPSEGMCHQGCEVSTAPTIPVEVYKAMIEGCETVEVVDIDSFGDGGELLDGLEFGKYQIIRKVKENE